MLSLSTLVVLVAIVFCSCLHKLKHKNQANFFDDHLDVPFYSTLLVILLTVGLLFCEVISYYWLLLIPIPFCFEQSYIWLFKAWFVVRMRGPFSHGQKELRSHKNHGHVAWAYKEIKNTDQYDSQALNANCTACKSSWYTGVLLYPKSEIWLCIEPDALNASVLVASVYQHTMDILRLNDCNKAKSFNENWAAYLDQQWNNSYGKWIREELPAAIWPQRLTYTVPEGYRRDAKDNGKRHVSTSIKFKVILWVIFCSLNYHNQNEFYAGNEDIISYNCWFEDEETAKAAHDTRYDMLWFFFLRANHCAGTSKHWLEWWMELYGLTEMQTYWLQVFFQEQFTVALALAFCWLDCFVCSRYDDWTIRFHSYRDANDKKKKKK